jgi:hypothetical protein
LISAKQNRRLSLSRELLQHIGTRQSVEHVLPIRANLKKRHHNLNLPRLHNKPKWCFAAMPKVNGNSRLSYRSHHSDHVCVPIADSHLECLVSNDAPGLNMRLMLQHEVDQDRDRSCLTFLTRLDHSSFQIRHRTSEYVSIRIFLSTWAGLGVDAMLLSKRCSYIMRTREQCSQGCGVPRRAQPNKVRSNVNANEYIENRPRRVIYTRQWAQILEGGDCGRHRAWSRLEMVLWLRTCCYSVRVRSCFGLGSGTGSESCRRP